MLAIVFIVCFAFLEISASAAAQSTCSTFGTISIDSGAYTFQNNEWNSSAEQCATVSGTGFKLTTADFNLPANGAPATTHPRSEDVIGEIAPAPIPFPSRKTTLHRPAPASP
jgi:hypothetical protein